MRMDTLKNLHAAHQGTTQMRARAQMDIWWPNMNMDIDKIRSKCKSCDEYAPSQAMLPPVPPRQPDYPLQLISTDLFDYLGNNYLIIVDRYSGWPVICRVNKATSSELISLFRQYFVTYGAPEEIVSDGGRQFESDEFCQFLTTWKVRHHLTSAYNPHSNLLAESCVRNMKRLIRENTDRNEGLNTDQFVQALLTYRNTPTRGLGVSPAIVLFNRKLRDKIPTKPGEFELRQELLKIMDRREKALSKRHIIGQEVWSRNTKDLPVLNSGQHVLVQNQKGPHSK